MSYSRLLPVAAITGTIVVGALSPMAARARQSVAADRSALLQGVDSVRAPGCLLGTLSLLDDSAFPVLTGRQGKGRVPIVAAAHAGQGRIVVYGHEGLLGGESLKIAGNAHLLTNAVRWASGASDKGVRVGVLGNGDAVPTLTAAGFTVTPFRAEDITPAGLAKFNVLLIDPDAFEGAQGKARAATAQAFVRKGGGLVTYGVGWGWQQIHPDASLAEDAGFNRLLVPLAGVGCSGGTADPTGPNGAFLADGVGLDAVSASAALAKLEQSMTGTVTLAPDTITPITSALTEATDILPADDTRILPRMKALIARVGPVTPTKYSPVTLSQPIARVAAVLEARELARTPIDQVKAHPSAASFPGIVPLEAPRLKDQTVSVDTHIPDWHSTGLYAAPGEIITVTVPASAAGKGLGIRIGAQRDGLWKVDSWPRFPEITEEKRLTTTTLRMASAFGGTIYVTVPWEGGGSQLGTVPVTISGAVAQPYFIKDKTSLADWANIRNAPAPWAELQGDKIILTVPSSVVRNLRDPQALMTYWDQVADAAADLYSIPHERRRQERYCVDVEISAGYMHSGYPIMTHDDVAPTFVSLGTLRGTDGLKTWGFYHELGHNHQKPEWTWDGLGEVTNNLLSLYGDETFNGVKPDYANSHPAIAPAARRKMLLTYLAKGVTPDGMTSDPFLALTFFIDLRQQFGWDPFKTVFGEYSRLSPSERPRSETEKHDQFMVRFSKAVGRNLGPYFTAWGVTTSEAARNSIASLPAWSPADWPTSAEVADEKAKLAGGAQSASR